MKVGLLGAKRKEDCRKHYLLEVRHSLVSVPFSQWIHRQSFSFEIYYKPQQIARGLRKRPQFVAGIKTN